MERATSIIFGKKPFDVSDSNTKIQYPKLMVRLKRTRARSRTCLNLTNQKLTHMRKRKWGKPSN